MTNRFIDYQSGRLFVEGCDVSDIAAEVPTPFYCYSQSAIEDAYTQLVKAVNHPRVKIFYAVKANSNIAVIDILGRKGAGMDIVSVGGMKRCLKAGVPASRIVFSGVGKTEDEMEAALRAGIYQFNAGSIPELHALSRVASRLNMTAPVCLRINPDVDAKSHAKISTGKKENKFGINWDEISEAYTLINTLPALKAVGLSMHIGSQMTDTDPFHYAFQRMEEMVARLRKSGQTVERVSLGGGIGISYRGEHIPLQAIGALINETAERLACDVELEPGRFLVGEAGILVTKVIYIKESTAKKFMIVDAAMNDLIRPTLYEAYHPMDRVVHSQDARIDTYDVVGPICESGDYLAHDRAMPSAQANDLIALFCAGAYGAVMSSCYNSRELIPEILVKNKKFAQIRARLTIEQQLAWETIPDLT